MFLGRKMNQTSRSKQHQNLTNPKQGLVKQDIPPTEGTSALLEASKSLKEALNSWTSISEECDKSRSQQENEKKAIEVLFKDIAEKMKLLDDSNESQGT
jgi:hypothetical protein